MRTLNFIPKSLIKTIKNSTRRKTILIVFEGLPPEITKISNENIKILKKETLSFRLESNTNISHGKSMNDRWYDVIVNATIIEVK